MTAVVAAIIIQDGYILCARRPMNKSLGGLWEFPGGKQEAGESLSQALKRELREELAVEVELGQEAYAKNTYSYEFGQVELTTYLARLKNSKPILKEHLALAWVLPEELKDLDWAPADQPIVEKLLEEDFSSGSWAGFPVP